MNAYLNSCPRVADVSSPADPRSVSSSCRSCGLVLRALHLDVKRPRSYTNRGIGLRVELRSRTPEGRLETSANPEAGAATGLLTYVWQIQHVSVCKISLVMFYYLEEVEVEVEVRCSTSTTLEPETRVRIPSVVYATKALNYNNFSSVCEILQLVATSNMQFTFHFICNTWINTFCINLI